MDISTKLIIVIILIIIAMMGGLLALCSFNRFKHHNYGRITPIDAPIQTNYYHIMDQVPTHNVDYKEQLNQIIYDYQHLDSNDPLYLINQEAIMQRLVSLKHEINHQRQQQ